VPEDNKLCVWFNEGEFELSVTVDLSIIKSDNSIEIDVDVLLYE